MRFCPMLRPWCAGETNKWARYHSDPRTQLNVIPANFPPTSATQNPSLSSHGHFEPGKSLLRNRWQFRRGERRRVEESVLSQDTVKRVSDETEDSREIFYCRLPIGYVRQCRTTEPRIET